MKVSVIACLNNLFWLKYEISSTYNKMLSLMPSNDTADKLTLLSVFKLHFHTNLEVRKSIFLKNVTKQFKKVGDNAKMTSN